MMNRMIATMGLAALVSLPAVAAVARSIPDAYARAGHKPIVLFCYGANTDKVNDTAYEVYIKSNKLQRETGKAVLVIVPLYQYPDDKQRKEMEGVLGPKGLPSKVYTTPSMVVMDSDGNLRGSVHEPELMQNPEKAFEALKRLLEAYDEQEGWIVKAEKASGARKSQLYLKAADVRGVDMPSLKNTDIGSKNRGKAGQAKAELQNRSNFDIEGVVQHLQVLDLGQAEGYVRGLMGKGYSILQRQWLLAALGGHFRRNQGSKDKMRQFYTEMRDLDPDSPYGAYAQGALDIWVDVKEKSSVDEVPAEITRVNNTISTEGSGKATPGANDAFKGIGNNTAMGTRVTPADADYDDPGADADSGNGADSE
ncbi:MAG: hypothetical protein ACI4PZ_02295 [Akkermansia sp.]